ncbi:MAG: sugar phosphate isomerase/epimerase family protein, partial [Geminicoccaceae bacterium]
LGDRLGYVHVNESHRGYLGTGSIDFDALFQALADHGYDGVITFEAFAAGIGDPALNAELAVWRPLWDDPDDLTRHARAVMIEKMQSAKARPMDQSATSPADAYPSTSTAGSTSGGPGARDDARGFGWSRRPS